MTDMLQAALEYASLGFRVFPCLPDEKKPAIMSWQTAATTDEDQIIAWWEENPRFNIAIATEGLCVIDFDGSEDDWPRGWEEFEGPISKTANDGRHLYTTQPPGKTWRNTAKKIHPNVDTRANGGYVIAPPSRVDGKPYSWLVNPCAPPRTPSWIAADLDQIHSRNGHGDLKEWADSARLIPEGQRNNVLTQIAGSLRRNGASEAAMVAYLLVVSQERCKPPLHEAEIRQIAHSIARKPPDDIAVGATEGVDLEPIEPFKHEHPDPGPFPEELVSMAPGLMREVIDFTLETAQRPNPIYALGGALALMGAITGRRIKDEQNTRTNQLLIIVGPSTSGKEWPMYVNNEILSTVGWSIIGPNRLISEAGIYTAMERQILCLMQIDEIGMVFRSIRKAQDKAHMTQIPSALIQIYNKASGTFNNAGYADAKKRPPADLLNPHLMLYGSTVLESFVQGITREDTTNGFMNRITLITSEVIVPQRDLGSFTVPDVPPASILDQVAEWRKLGSDQGDLHNVYPRPRTLKYEPDALIMLNDFGKSCDKNLERVMWGRAVFEAKKWAMDFSASEAGPGVQTITTRAVEWGILATDWQISKKLYLAESEMTSNQFEADQLAMSKWIRGKGKTVMWKLGKRFSGTWDGAYRKKLLDALKEQGKVGVLSTPQPNYRPGRPTTTIVWRGG
jgi:hypothetical protein